MLTKLNWKEYIEHLKAFNDCWDFDEDVIDMYKDTIITITITPLTICLDILLLPFEIGFIIFKKAMKKRIKTNDKGIKKDI